MSHVYVTLVGHMVAVASTEDIATMQVIQLIHGETRNIVAHAAEKGEYSKSLTIRVARVELNCL